MDTTMRFCPTCDNLFYLTIEDTVQYKCKKCGTVEDIGEDCTLSQTFCNQPRQNVQNSVNKYTKLDPTLPRINNVLCPNSECATNNGDALREIIYIRYDDRNMKYVYLCSECDTIWQTNETA